MGIIQRQKSFDRFRGLVLDRFVEAERNYNDPLASIGFAQFNGLRKGFAAGVTPSRPAIDDNHLPFVGGNHLVVARFIHNPNANRFALLPPQWTVDTDQPHTGQHETCAQQTCTEPPTLRLNVIHDAAFPTKTFDHPTT